MRPPEKLLASYRRRLEAVRTGVRSQIEELYADVDPNAIDASFATFIAAAAPVLEAGQASTAALAAAFVRSFTLARTGRLIDVDDVEELAGTRQDGSPIAAGMEAFGPMVLGRIADGATVEAAMDFGRYLATRYADGELTSVADRAVAETKTTRVRSWEGIVTAGSCDGCQANAGVHDIDEPIYRHPGCNCVYVPLLDAAV